MKRGIRRLFGPIYCVPRDAGRIIRAGDWYGNFPVLLRLFGAVAVRVACVAACLLCLPGCYHLTVNKYVFAMPGATVEMNSTTAASGNSSDPTTTPTLELDVTP